MLADRGAISSNSIDDYQLRLVDLRPVDRVARSRWSLLVLEAVRRTVGWSLIVIALFFCFHALTANQFPGVFFGPPISFEFLLQTLLFGDTGLFGIPIFVMAQYIVLFLLFGRLLQSTGAGAFFTRLAFAFFGHRVGGPAKAAVDLIRPVRDRIGQRRQQRADHRQPSPSR